MTKRFTNPSSSFTEADTMQSNDKPAATKPTQPLCLCPICRTVVLISGSGSNLQALIDAQLAGTLNIKIEAVISNRPNVKGLERAKKVGIDALTLDHTTFTDRKEFDQALQNTIDHYQPDLIILAGFMRVLSEGFVNHYLGKMLNIHPSLLPKFQGLHTHQRALEAGEREHGCSVHFVTPELDGGPVIVQAKVILAQDENEESLAKKVQQLEHKIYPLAVHWFANKRLTMQGHTAVLDGEALPKQGYQFLQTHNEVLS